MDNKIPDYIRFEDHEVDEKLPKSWALGCLLFVMLEIAIVLFAFKEIGQLIGVIK